jgi:hypothetical protein
MWIRIIVVRRFYTDMTNAVRACIFNFREILVLTISSTDLLCGTLGCHDERNRNDENREKKDFFTHGKECILNRLSYNYEK